MLLEATKRVTPPFYVGTHENPRGRANVIIDCDGCAMQHTTACDDCIVTVLLGQTGSGVLDVVEVQEDESWALQNLADAGLVAPLRLVPRADDAETATG